MKKRILKLTEYEYYFKCNPENKSESELVAESVDYNLTGKIPKYFKKKKK